MQQDKDKAGEDGPEDPIRPILMIVFPRRELSKIAKFFGVVRVTVRFLAVPIVVFLVDLFWETIDLVIEWILTALGLQLGLIVVIVSLPPSLILLAREVRRIRRLRGCTSTVDPPLTLEELRKLKLCPGSGRSAMNGRHWKDGVCQHCWEAVEISDRRIADHLLGSFSIGFEPVECDPRLFSAVRRGFGRDQPPSPSLPSTRE